MKSLLPPYLMHLLAVMIQIYTSELYRDTVLNRGHSAWDSHGAGNSDLRAPGNYLDMMEYEYRLDWSRRYKNNAIVACSLINLLNFLIYCKQSYYLGFDIFRRKWSVMDMWILSLNFVNTASLVIDIGIQRLRVVESILCILQWFKFLYFMQLVDDIAPYVNIIFVIFNDI